MTIEEFAKAVVLYRRRHHASVKSWGRSDAHTVSVGGFIGDPHCFDLGVDLEYDGGPNRPNAETHLRSPRSCQICSELGLKVIHEKAHDHLQPLDFPKGPVTAYGDQVKTWA